MNMHDQFTIAEFEDSPVRIRNNTEFSIQGWPGNGTPSSPYLLENLTIIPAGRYAIDISDTDAFLIIRNCTFWLPEYYSGGAILLYNVTNVRIMNCTITVEGNGYGAGEYSYAMYIAHSSNIRITESTITGYGFGIGLVQSASCFIGHSVFKDQQNTGIWVIACNDTATGANTVIGNDLRRSYFGIYVMGTCLNCSVISNTVSNCLL
jgi:parallel beta-helix repeat protein